MRIVVRLPVPIAKTAAGAEVASATPCPSGNQLGAGETVDLAREHGRERRAETSHVAGRDPRQCEAVDDLGAAELVAEDPARDREARSRFRERGAIRDRAPAEACADDAPLHRERVGRRDPRTFALDGACHERGQGELAVARDLRERGDAPDAVNAVDP